MSAIFLAAWERWRRHRREKRAKLTATCAESQLNSLSEMGIDRAVTAINHSITNGWTGIFEPKHQGPRPSGQAQPFDALAELKRQAEEERRGQP